MKILSICLLICLVSISDQADFPAISSKTFHFHKTNVGNWYKAFHYCDSHGMRLATIRSKDENDRFVNIAKSGGVQDKFWIGAMNVNDDKFYYLGHEEPMTYFNWWSGEPNNLAGLENCVEIFAFENGNFQWNDAQCSDAKYFMCETTTNSNYSAIF